MPSHLRIPYPLSTFVESQTPRKTKAGALLGPRSVRRVVIILIRQLSDPGPSSFMAMRPRRHHGVAAIAC